MSLVPAVQLFFQISMNVPVLHAKMMAVALMELILSHANVDLDTAVPTVKQVSYIKCIRWHGIISTGVQLNSDDLNCFFSSLIMK